MAKEFEVKYRVSPEAFSRLEADFGPFREITMETTYYDTPDKILSARRWTLRRRMENGVSVCTLKTPGQGLARGEWETECPDIRGAIPKLLALGAPGELEAITAQGLTPFCGAQFVRLAKHLSYGSSTLELALDRGKLMGQRQEVPLLEVEAELKEGRETDVLAFGAALAAKYGLTPEEKSKVARAMELE